MSIEKLIADLAPHGAKYAFPLERAMIGAGMDSNLEKAHFLAQIAYESAGFTAVEENLNYSATRLMQVFPKYFRNQGIAIAYEHHPSKIANRVYANRLGNRDEISGDGYAYRGRGLIQLTGHDNYAACGEGIGAALAITPDIMIDPEISAQAAVWFWRAKHCVTPALNDDLAGVTRLINGGLNGLEGRKTWLIKVKALLAKQTHN